MKVRSQFLSWFALTLLFQPTLSLAQETPGGEASTGTSVAPQGFTAVPMTVISPYSVAPVPLSALPPTQPNQGSAESPVKVKAAAGITSLSGQGVGAAGEFTLSPYRVGTSAKNPDGSSMDAGISAGPQLHLQGQSGIDDQGKATLARGQFQLRIAGGADVSAATSEGSGSVSEQFFGGAEYNRNLALGREHGGNLHAGGRFEIKSNDVTFRWTQTGELGMNKSNGKIVPYLQTRSVAELEKCVKLGDSDKDQVCAELSAMVALGLIQVEVGAGAALSYQRKIADDGTKLYVGPMASG